MLLLDQGKQLLCKIADGVLIRDVLAFALVYLRRALVDFIDSPTAGVRGFDMGRRCSAEPAGAVKAPLAEPIRPLLERSTPSVTSDSSKRESKPDTLTETE